MWAPDNLKETGTTSSAIEYIKVIGAIGVLTFAVSFTSLSHHALGHVYLLAVMLLCLRVGRGPMLVAAAGSALAWSYFFIPPHYSFQLQDYDDGILLGIYFVVVIIVGQLTVRIRTQAREAGALLTEREQLRAVAEREQRLAEADRLHRSLFDSVSHELKTPLAVLRSAGEKLDTAEPDRRMELSHEIKTATQRLERLVANLLNQNRLESGTLRAQLDWCDLRDVLQAARRSVEPLLASRPFTAGFEVDFPLILADVPLMEHAIANLLLNAVHHTPAGTPIEATAGIAQSAKGPRVFLRVADRGPGLSAELRERLFQKFSRGAQAQSGGLGLGLSIVRGFMLAQGGEVTAGDNPGGGAVFTLWLPHVSHGEVPDDES